MMEEIRKAGKIKPFDVIDVLIMILFILIMAYPLWWAHLMKERIICGAAYICGPGYGLWIISKPYSGTKVY